MRLLQKLLNEKELKQYDAIGLEFATMCLKNDKLPPVIYNISPTLTTKCNVAVAVRKDDEV